MVDQADIHNTHIPKVIKVEKEHFCMDKESAKISHEKCAELYLLP